MRRRIDFVIILALDLLVLAAIVVSLGARWAFIVARGLVCSAPLRSA
jgi:hypothetical protein